MEGLENVVIQVPSPETYEPFVKMLGLNKHPWIPLIRATPINGWMTLSRLIFIAILPS